MKPAQSILNPKFRYKNAANTDIAATFRRRQRELKAEAEASAAAASAQKAVDDAVRDEINRKLVTLPKRGAA